MLTPGSRMNVSETKAMLKTLLEQEERIERLEKTLESLESVTEEDIRNLRDAVEARVIELLGGEQSLAYIRIGAKTINACMRDVRMTTLCVPRYSEMKKSDYAEALELINKWGASGATQVAIKYFEGAEVVNEVNKQ